MAIDPFAFKNQRRGDRIDAQGAAAAGNKNRKNNGKNNGNGGKGGNQNPNDSGNDLASDSVNRTWNDQPQTYLQFLAGQAGMSQNAGAFNNFASSLYSDIENQYNNAMATAKNNDLDFTDWLKRQDQFGSPYVTGANKKNPNLHNVDSFGNYIRDKYYGASDSQRGLDRVGYGAGSTRWSAF